MRFVCVYPALFLLCLQTSNKDFPKTPDRLFQRLLCLFSRKSQVPLLLSSRFSYLAIGASGFFATCPGWGSRGRCPTDTLPSHLPLQRSNEAGIRKPFLVRRSM